MHSTVKRYIVEQTKMVTEFKKAEKIILDIKKIREQKKEELYRLYQRRVKDSPVLITDSQQIAWLKTKANILDEEPKDILKEFKKRNEQDGRQ